MNCKVQVNNCELKLASKMNEKKHERHEQTKFTMRNKFFPLCKILINLIYVFEEHF